MPSQEDEEKKIPTENILNDIVNTIREKQEDIGKSLSEYSISLFQDHWRIYGNRN